MYCGLHKDSRKTPHKKTPARWPVFFVASPMQLREDWKMLFDARESRFRVTLSNQLLYRRHPFERHIDQQQYLALVDPGMESFQAGIGQRSRRHARHPAAQHRAGQRQRYQRQSVQMHPLGR